MSSFQKPKVFIGSTSEQHEIAVGLQRILERRELDVMVWSQGVFKYNSAYFESLFAALDEYDFAFFIASADDFTVSRSRGKDVPRDNIIFEAGLFLGRYDKTRVFILHPRDKKPHFPTDWDGIKFIEYDLPSNREDIPSKLEPSVMQTFTAIDEHGLRDRVSARRYKDVLHRGQIDASANISDAAIAFFERRHDIKSAIIKHIRNDELIPAKYFYYTDEGASLWMQMCKSALYKFHRNSTNSLSKQSLEIARIIKKHIKGDSIDFVSLGSGDGSKDKIILSSLSDAGFDNNYYYPIDFSDKLLVDAIRGASKKTKHTHNLMVKGVVADICDLSALASVYEYRPNPNIFSIIGNTFGNSDEARITRELEASLNDGDIVIIEVNTDYSDGKVQENFYNSDLNKSHSCNPLSMIGVDVDINLLEMEEIEGASLFSSASSTVFKYPVDIPNVITKPNALISANHKYKFAEFCEEIQASLRVKELYSQETAGVGLFVGQRDG